MGSPEAAEFIQEACGSPQKWTALKLGEEQGPTEGDRRQLGIRAIAPADITPLQRQQAKKIRERLKKQRQRRAKGMRAQTESGNRIKPWIAANISPAKWYRLQRETTLSPNMPDCPPQAGNIQRHTRLTSRFLASRYEKNCFRRTAMRLSVGRETILSPSK
jgi:hypothetical protein